MLKVTVVIGNPKPQSRTGKIAETFARRFVGSANADLRIIDLADHAPSLFAWPSQSMAELNAQVSDSTIIICASPTYKASYTGLLKAFLDRFPANGLRNVVCIPLMTGADSGHSMAPTVNLVPLLLELGAIVPTCGLYFNTSQMDQADQFIDSGVEQVRKALDVIASVHSNLAASEKDGRKVA